MAVRELTEPPRLVRLYARAAMPSRDRDADLPDTELVLADQRIDRDHLAEYDRVCGFTLRDQLPPTYPHLLAFPLSVEIMVRPDFPFALPGLIHVANRVTQHRPIAASESLTVRVRTEHLRAHAKGQQFDIAASAEVDGATVWTSTSTYLARGAAGGEPEPSPGASGDTGIEPGTPDPPTTAIWDVDAGAGRRYAAVSGDRNPIHLHPLTSRPFGHKRPIAHGMWTKARSLAALEGRLPHAFTVEVAFDKPLRLPSRVAFASEVRDGSWRFAVRAPAGERHHLHGRLGPLETS